MFSLLFSSLGADVSGRIVFAPVSSLVTSSLGEPPESGGERNTTARVHLDGGERVSLVTPEGFFLFENVSAGLHALDVIAAEAIYPSLVVDVSQQAVESALEFHYLGAMGLPARLPMQISPVAASVHFDPRPPSMIWGMLGSPMVWMGGVMVILMLFLQSQDPEDMKAMCVAASWSFL
jgi:hypothetical protein